MKIKILIFIDYCIVCVGAHTHTHTHTIIINVQYCPATTEHPYSRNFMKHFMNKIMVLGSPYNPSRLLFYYV